MELGKDDVSEEKVWAHPRGRFYHGTVECCRSPGGANLHLAEYSEMGVNDALRRGKTRCPMCFELPTRRAVRQE